MDNLNDKLNDELIDRCPIWNEDNEVISEFGRSCPGFPNIIGEMLKNGVEPEKVSYNLVSKMYVDRFGAGLSFDECVKKYNLKPIGGNNG